MVPMRRALPAALLTLLALATAPGGIAQGPAAPSYDSQAQADAASTGCLSCHTATDRRSMHASDDVLLSCVDCHGGNGTARRSPGFTKRTKARSSSRSAV